MHLGRPKSSSSAINTTKYGNGRVYERIIIIFPLIVIFFDSFLKQSLNHFSQSFKYFSEENIISRYSLLVDLTSSFKKFLFTDPLNNLTNISRVIFSSFLSADSSISCSSNSKYPSIKDFS